MTALHLNSRARRLGLLLLCVALAARVGLILAQPGFTPIGDAAEYDSIAASIAVSGHYPPSTRVPRRGPSTFRPPAYPYLLAGAYAVTGTARNTSRFEVGRVVGAMLGTITVALIGLIAYLLWGRWAGVAATAIAAIYPQLIAVSDSLLSETLFTPLVLASVTCILLQKRSKASYRWTIGAGFCLGLAALTRVNGIVIVVALLIGLMVLGQKRRLRASGILVGTALLVISPWLVRDAVVFKAFVPVSDETGYTLAGTYNDVSRTSASNPGAWRAVPGAPYDSILRRSNLNEVQMNAKLETAALRYMEKHPTYVAKVGMWNLLRFLEVTGNRREQLGARETGVGPNFSDASRVAFWILVLLMCASVVLVPATRAVPTVVWLTPLLLLLSVLFVNASARYRTPVDAFLIIAAASLLASLKTLTSPLIAR